MSEQESTLIRIDINGTAYSVSSEQTLRQALLATGHLTADAAPAGMALALNQAVIPAALWDEQTLAEGDCLQLFHAIAGG